MAEYSMLNRHKCRSGVAGICVCLMLNPCAALAAVPQVNIAQGPLLACGGELKPKTLAGSFRDLPTSSAIAISPDGAFAYESGFNVSTWSGSLKKRAISYDQNGAATLAATPAWDAAAILTGMNGSTPYPVPEARRLYTAKAMSGKPSVAVPFRWEQLSADQRGLLNISPDNGVVDGMGEKRLNYLRGMRNLERGQPGGVFRTRDSVLGDIVNSHPVYAGAPETVDGSADYQKFFDANKNREKTVYVGANDGMLHAFSADDGQELFAYIPGMLVQHLAKYTAAGYVHRPYADSTVTVGDAIVAKQWKTVLASGMGGGAQGIYALDVTNPSDFERGAGVIWEFTDSDDADMGNLMSAPRIAKFKTKVTKGVPEYKYFVVAPSGLNNYKNDGANKFDDAAPGALFLLSLDKEPSAKWRLGVNYYKIKTPISDAALQSGLASPAIVAGTDGAVRFAYAGDLQGNLWRFDFQDDAPWKSALGTAPYKPLFSAMDAQDIRQPITTQPSIVFAPGGGYVVLFGTGKFLEHADSIIDSFKTQSFYGIYDTGGDAYGVANRSELAPRFLIKLSSTGGDVFEVSGAAFSYGDATGSNKGWFFDFPDSDKTGERGVANSVIAGGKLFFNSLIPGSASCVAGGGRSYILDTLTGMPAGGLTGLQLDGILPSLPILLPARTEVGDRNAIGKRSIKKKFPVLESASGAKKDAVASTPNGSADIISVAGRLSWREVINWQELRDAARKK